MSFGLTAKNINIMLRRAEILGLLDPFFYEVWISIFRISEYQNSKLQINHQIKNLQIGESSIFKLVGCMSSKKIAKQF